MSDEEIRVQLARIDERMKVMEKQVSGAETKIWGAVVLILVYVANQFLGLLQIGGM